LFKLKLQTYVTNGEGYNWVTRTDKDLKHQMLEVKVNRQFDKQATKINEVMVE